MRSRVKGWAMSSKSQSPFSAGRRGDLKGLGAATGIEAASFADGARAATTITAPLGEDSAIGAGAGLARVETSR